MRRRRAAAPVRCQCPAVSTSSRSCAKKAKGNVTAPKSRARSIFWFGGIPSCCGIPHLRSSTWHPQCPIENTDGGRPCPTFVVCARSDPRSGSGHFPSRDARTLAAIHGSRRHPAGCTRRRTRQGITGCRLALPRHRVILLRNALGAPVVVNTRPDGRTARLSMAHSGCWVACSVSDRPTGMDLEFRRGLSTPALRAMSSENRSQPPAHRGTASEPAGAADVDGQRS